VTRVITLTVAFSYFVLVLLCRTCAFVYLRISVHFLIGSALLSLPINEVNDDDDNNNNSSV